MKNSTLRVTVFVLLLVSALALTVFLFRGSLSVLVAEKVVAQRLKLEIRQDLTDGLHVGLCGAGSPFPDEKRTGPCTLVVAGAKLFVFDAGNAANAIT